MENAALPRILEAYPGQYYAIASTNLIVLLEDEIFADFFNTFLSLPIKFKLLSLAHSPRYLDSFMNLMDVLHHPVHLEYFKEFLRANKAENLLSFILAMQKASSEPNEKAQKALVDAILNTFFHNKDSDVEDILQCTIPILKEISYMNRVPLVVLHQAQNQVLKYLDDKWFKTYQDMFPHRLHIQIPDVEIPQKVPKKETKTINLELRKKRVWIYLSAIIRSICKFRREMKKPESRRLFEDFLRKEMTNHKENVDMEDIVFVKRRILGHKTVIINFLVNDLNFFIEIEKFNDLVSSALVLQVNKVFNENDVALMKAKGHIIYKLFLSSDIPPRLRVNISEITKDSIYSAITDGHLDRAVFHNSVMTIFPIIMYFWKKYCNWKAKRDYLRSWGKKSKEHSPARSVSPKQNQWSGGDHVVMRFSLVKGIEWLLPQPREEVESPGAICKSVDVKLMEPAELL
ncbi:regulator of G-protein signaling protein-like [Sarcophilus harrisii]